MPSNDTTAKTGDESADPNVPATAISNRPADVPAVDPGTPAAIALIDQQITAIDRLIMLRRWGAQQTWARQMDTGEIVILEIAGDAPSAEEIGAVIDEPVTMTSAGKDWNSTATYRLDRDDTWCRTCKWINGHWDYCMELPPTERALSTGMIDALGLDSSGCDGDPRFPFRWSNLTERERDEVRSLQLFSGDPRCAVCGGRIGYVRTPGCPLCESAADW